MSTKKINLPSPEFDQIKANLKNYLRDQPQFSDYGFEGSNMLVDIIKQEILGVCQNFEPRINVQLNEVKFSQDDHYVEVTVQLFLTLH